VVWACLNHKTTTHFSVFLTLVSIHYIAFEDSVGRNKYFQCQFLSEYMKFTLSHLPLSPIHLVNTMTLHTIQSKIKTALSTGIFYMWTIYYK